jgi:hypothetical protein
MKENQREKELKTKKKIWMDGWMVGCMGWD